MTLYEFSMLAIVVILPVLIVVCVKLLNLDEEE